MSVKCSSRKRRSAHEQTRALDVQIRFREGVVRRQLWPKTGSAKQERQRAGAVTRQLRLVRAHGLLRKVSGTHRYVVTTGGRKIITALLAAPLADVEQLTALAA
jgi:hypothetical protein